jgi:hypothetical protein
MGNNLFLENKEREKEKEKEKEVKEEKNSNKIMDIPEKVRTLEIKMFIYSLI